MEVVGALASGPATPQCRPCSNLGMPPNTSSDSATFRRVFFGENGAPLRPRSEAVPMVRFVPQSVPPYRGTWRNCALQGSLGVAAYSAKMDGARAEGPDTAAGGCAFMDRRKPGRAGIEVGADGLDSAALFCGWGSSPGGIGVYRVAAPVRKPANSGRCCKCRHGGHVFVTNSETFKRSRQLDYLPPRLSAFLCRRRLPDSRKYPRFAARHGPYSSELEEPQPQQKEEGEESGTKSISPQQLPNVKYIRSDTSSEQPSLSSPPSASNAFSRDSGIYDGSFEFSQQRRSPSLHQFRSKPYRNRLLGLSKIGTIINDAAESFFKSEIRRRIFVTVVLIVASRLGYFIPIPGFDRRFMPGGYKNNVSGAVEELGDLVSELKLAVFQLGISPYIFSSIIMQLATHVVPKLTKLRKEGLDGNEKIKKYTWWLALVIAIVESLVVSFHSLQYSVYGAHNSLRYVMVTSGLLTTGAMTINWICEKITVAGFGQGSSLIICISILTGYSENLYKMISNLLNGTTTWVPLGLFLGCFFLITMWAVIVTEGRRKVKLQYYDFEFANSAGGSSALPEVEPYIPFNINPTGMQPVLTTTYLMALPSLVAGLTGNKSFVIIRDTLNPAYPTAPGAQPWLYYFLNAMFIFIFNVLDIMDTPKEVADYMMKIGARIPSIKPGRRTIEYLTKVQASTRFWGGLLLALLATVSTLVDYRFRYLHQGGTIGFTSMLIIVGSIVELRRSFLAYNVMPSLSKVLKRYGV